MFLFVGNKNLFGEGGISTFRCSDQNGSLSFLSTQHLSISAGYMCIDEKNDRLFSVNERTECEGVPGGEILCYKINKKDGNLTFLSKISTHTVLPCYLYYISQEQRLLVCNHAKRDWSLRLEMTSEGLIYGKKVYDDAAIEVFDILPDGTIVGPKSTWIAPMAEGAYDNPHLHSITHNKTTRQLYVCDTGCDMIYTITLNKEGILSHLCTTKTELHAGTPRYGVAHPYMSVVYFNSERENAISVYETQGDSLSLLQIAQADTALDSGLEPLGQSDIAINHAGTILYTLIRQKPRVNAFNIAHDGKISFIQTWHIEFENPRALIISPDDKHLFIACSTGRTVIRIDVDDNGQLCSQNLENNLLSSPSSMVLFDPHT